MKSEFLPFDTVKDMIANATSITILSHLNPDADTLGTALGIYALLTKDKNKRVEVVNASNALPKHLDFLPYFQKIKYKMDYPDSLIIACDCGNIDRLGFDLSHREILNIDHHKSNTLYGTVNVVIPEYASASQVAYTLFDTLYEIDDNTATCFYAALLSDTRHFTTTSVNEEVFSLAQVLLSKGAKADEIVTHFTQRKPLASLRILEKALASLTLYEEAKIAVMYLKEETILASGANTSDMEGIVDYARSLVTVEVAIFAMEVKDGVRISLRSKTVDVSPIAITFGGGGHKIAAGFTLSQCNVETSIDIILAKIKEMSILPE